MLQPHPIQVISILRFIGLDKVESIKEKAKKFGANLVGIELDKLKNHLMQIKTGEGKSIILGAMSLLLAIMGY